MRIRFVKSPKAILQHSLEDIKAGRWKTGKLAIIPDEAFNGIEPSHDVFKATEAVNEGVIDGVCDVEMGCALGLLSMHAGHGEKLKHGFFMPEYPANRPYKRPMGLEEAVRTLHRALPHREDYDWANSDTASIDSLQSDIITFNDDADQPTAREWFERAVESAPVRVKA